MSDPYGDGRTASAATYPCGGCGARVEFAPGTNVLQCPYCGFRQEITASNGQVREIALEDLDVLARKPVGQLAPYTLVCQRCAASTETTETAGLCQFCGSPLVMDAAATGQIIPEGVLPFEVDHNGIREALGKWVSSRWFAPSAFKKVAAAESTKGTYVPHWTFDAEAFSAYSGQQGRHYWVTENDGEGRTKRVRRTRWARGHCPRPGPTSPSTSPVTTRCGTTWNPRAASTRPSRGCRGRSTRSADGTSVVTSSGSSGSTPTSATSPSS